MPFFIAVVLLLILSSVYLLHQFWSHAFVHDPAAPDSDRDNDRQDTLKAA